MSVFDLLFIAVFLATITTLIAAAVAAVRGRRAKAASILRGLGAAIGAYFAIVIVVSLASPRREFRVGEARCYDDWCIAVENVKQTPSAAGIAYRVTFRVSSRARRVSQHEYGLDVYLTDNAGNRFDPKSAVDAPPFSVLVKPGDSVETTRIFNVPAQAHDLDLIIGHTGVFPGCCIIADEGSLFHKPAILRIP